MNEGVPISRTEGHINKSGIVNLSETDLGTIKTCWNLSWNRAISIIDILSASDNEISGRSLNGIAPCEGVIRLS